MSIEEYLNSGDINLARIGFELLRNDPNLSIKDKEEIMTRAVLATDGFYIHNWVYFSKPSLFKDSTYKQKGYYHIPKKGYTGLTYEYIGDLS